MSLFFQAPHRELIVKFTHEHPPVKFLATPLITAFELCQSVSEVVAVPVREQLLLRRLPIMTSQCAPPIIDASQVCSTPRRSTSVFFTKKAFSVKRCQTWCLVLCSGCFNVRRGVYNFLESSSASLYTSCEDSTAWLGFLPFEFAEHFYHQCLRNIE